MWSYAKFFSSMGILTAEAAKTSTRGRSTQISLLNISAAELDKELSATLETETKGE
jgi:hypothetical protein